MERKKFFKTAGKGFVGFTILSSLPFNFGSMFSSGKSKKIQIKENPLAMRRNKLGDKNV